MALITEDLRIPDVGELFPRTRRRRASLLKPCGTAAAWRRHQRRGEPQDELCKEWKRGFSRQRYAARRPVTIVLRAEDARDLREMLLSLPLPRHGRAAAIQLIEQIRRVA